jgi:beta-N-acetylhexosaminidase
MTEINRRILSQTPFNLGAEAQAWVLETLQAMDTPTRVRQLFVHMSSGQGQAEAERIASLSPGGVARFFGSDPDAELELLDALHRSASIPLLICADVEGSQATPPFATFFPNALSLAAIDDVAITRDVARVMAVEAHAGGINWSLTPVLDIDATFGSSIVGTRSFGSDPERVQRHALAQIDAFQSEGIAATAKHWPGEGHDQRDQHLMTTSIPLSVAEWEASHGSLYRSAIDAGVLSIMSGHISFPAFVRELDPNPGVEAYRPASLSHTLNQSLLRDRFGFNGVIVSDATIMGGYRSWGRHADILPDIIAGGCDLILFSEHPQADFLIVEKAIETGKISEGRLAEAVLRVLAMKAALGLHQSRTRVDRSKLKTAERLDFARSVFARVPTLVKDVKKTLPLNPSTHSKLLVYSTGLVHIGKHNVALVLPEMLRSEGFDVTVTQTGEDHDPQTFDVVLYVLAEESQPLRGRIFFDWTKFSDDFQSAMRRPWHDVPTIVVSLGHPYYLYDVPRMPCLINAYASVSEMQKAVVDGIVGRTPFLGRTPVDAFCGQPEALF